MFVTLQGGNYMANLYLFLVIYPLNHEENSEKIERQFQCVFFQIQLDSWKYLKLIFTCYNSINNHIIFYYDTVQDCRSGCRFSFRGKGGRERGGGEVHFTHYGLV